MRIVVGHANPDFDAYAATVAATKLFPGAKGVFLGSQNANVRSFHNLHEEFLEFVDLKGLDLEAVDSVVMVDTRDPDRIGEFAEVVRRPGVEVIVYDHHPAQEGDIEGADDRSMEVGAVTSVLVHEIKRQGIELAPLEASLLLLGIHEDTGSLTYPGSTAYDADAAAFLMASGADIEVLNQFLSRTLDEPQRALLAQLEDSLELWEINGQQIAVGVARAREYVDSASVLTHYVVEDMGYRAAIAIVSMPGRTQIVARSRLAEIDVGAVMKHLGGGGHHQAASAGFSRLSIDEGIARVRDALEAEVRPPLRAADIMSSPVRTISPDATMREAADLMSRWGHGGLPVVEDDRLIGVVGRKAVDKASRHGLDHAPVTGFVGSDPITIGPDLELSELERLLATRGIGRLPVIENGQLIGIVTRKDVLRAEHGDAYLDRRAARLHPKATEQFITSVETILPQEVREVLHRIGELAARQGVRAHVVGGFVRDMVLGRPNLDLDIVVEGDGVEFAELAAASLGGRVRAHRRFGTAVIVLDGGLHVDVASSRTEYYSRPGALPTVERSSLRQDLLRRDFTINAMAACVDPDCFGRIADPYGGLKDLESGTVRVLHPLSFIDDPTRLLRAARFEVRYGFSLDPASERHARRAVDLRVLEEVTGARLREELADILAEKTPAVILRRLDALGVLRSVIPEGSKPGDVVRAVESIDVAYDRLAAMFSRRPTRKGAQTCAIAATAARDACDKWLRRMRFSRDVAAPAAMLCTKRPTVLKTLQDRRGMKDSRLYRTLQPLAPEVLVNLWSLGDDLAKSRVERYVAKLSRVRPAVNGRDLLEMGAAPKQGFSAILARALEDRLDGRAIGRQAELANLRRIASRAGALPPR